VKNSDRIRIVELYTSGMSSRTIAEQLDLGRTTVLDVLKRAEVAVRPRGRQPQGLPRDQGHR